MICDSRQNGEANLLLSQDARAQVSPRIPMTAVELLAAVSADVGTDRYGRFPVFDLSCRLHLDA